MLKRIDHRTAEEICAQQVISSLAMAVKELLENSLDAGSTSVEIRCREYGTESIEVADDGPGIPRDQHASIGLRHHTSKLAKFEDLERVRSYGFRGEAIHALCSMSAEVSMATCVDGASVGQRVVFNHDGTIKQSTPMARPRGTTFTVKGFFERLPVRASELKRHGKREFAKVIHVVTEYMLACPRVRISLVNMPASGGTGAKQEILSSRGGQSAMLKDAMLAVFRGEAFQQMERLQLVNKGNAGETTSDEPRITIDGYISKPGKGRSQATSKQHITINNRPCHLAKWARFINEVYRQNHPTQYPSYVLNIALPAGTYDVNITPDKRILLIHDEHELLTWFRDALSEFVASSAGMMDLASTPATQRHQPSIASIVPGIAKSTQPKESEKPVLQEITAVQTVDGNAGERVEKPFALPKRRRSSLAPSIDTTITVTDDDHELRSSTKSYIMKLKRGRPKNDSLANDTPAPPSVDDAVAEDALKRRLTTKHFSSMNAIGQFNKGFILATLNDENNQFMDVFIVDQHAGDEKYRYEKFLREMSMHSQRLVCPLRVDCSPTQRLLIEQFDEQMRRNGFRVLFSDDGNVSLAALPMVNGKPLGTEDFDELLDNLSQLGLSSDSAADDLELSSCSKIRKMMASKACRSAWMIGDALSRKDMRQILDQMAVTKHPWNCPHGRPSMRWLFRLPINNDNHE